MSRPRRWIIREWFWVIAILFVGLVMLLGYTGFTKRGDDVWDAIYHSIQLFGLNFERRPDGGSEPGELQWARFLASIVLIGVVVKLVADGLVPRVRLWFHVRGAKPRDVVIGFGPAGREIGRRLLERGRAVTWLDRIEGNDEDLRSKREDAERMGGLLITGDPSAPENLRQARLDREQRVFVALSNDLAGFDAAEAIQAAAKDANVRVFTENPVVAATLPAAAAAGFATGRGMALFNLRAEAARRLVLTARWDRLALLLGQERVHLVIAGLGWQGEALMEEALLLCNRAGLKPPLVTAIDIDAAGAEARLRRRCPALFDPDMGVAGWLPPRFVEADLETADLAALDLTCGAPGGEVPVTAWAFLTADDDLNLRAALHLQTAMLSGKRAGAPIHVRIWEGHAGETHRIGRGGLAIATPFGGLEEGLDQTAALEDDPDRTGKALHAAYEAARLLNPLTVGRKPNPESWEDISPSKQTSNRRAHRHAAMKLNDLGYEWRERHDGRLPTLPEADRAAFSVAHVALQDEDFAKAAEGAEDQNRMLAAMINEHDRWTIDRALDGWSPAPKKDERLLAHDCMKPWRELDLYARVYDGVLIRALVDRADERPPLRAHPRRVVRVNAPYQGAVTASEPPGAWGEATDIEILLPAGDTARPDDTRIDPAAAPYPALAAALRAAAQDGRICDLTLVFPAPPLRPVLALAEALAEAARAEGVTLRPVWAWGRNLETPEAAKRAFDGLPHTFEAPPEPHSATEPFVPADEAARRWEYVLRGR